MVMEYVDVFGPGVLRKEVEVSTHINKIRGVDPLVGSVRRRCRFGGVLYTSVDSIQVDIRETGTGGHGARS
jgi:hypothetical protein